MAGRRLFPLFQEAERLLFDAGRFAYSTPDYALTVLASLKRLHIPASRAESLKRLARRKKVLRA